MQADTLIPNPHNSLDWNRYSYARYNPLLYTDPTGHVPCDEDGVCGDNIINSTYSKLIKDKFKWNLKGSWTTDELKTIYETGQDIEAYVDGLTGGKGLEWMLRAFANTTIEHVDFSNGRSDALPVWGGSRIRLNNNWLTDAWGAKVVLAHELGHVWDINTGFAASYNMNRDLGGSGVCLFCAPGNNVPQWINTYHQTPSGDAYGNSGRNEYFAEAFSATIYHRAITPNDVALWVDKKISVPVGVYPWRRP